MGKPPTLLFGVHCHQPVGNFHEVMEHACKRAYLPFLEVAREYSVPFSVHYSGPLLEWLEHHGQRVLDIVGELVERGQVEVLVSGAYEPILPAIPSWDRVGQLEMAKEWVLRIWGVEPKGLWLTERVWEPQIVKELVAAGIEYVVVDDYHLLCAGMNREDIHGHFLTEDQGSTLAVFPINKALRYLVPFEKMERVKKEISNLASGRAYTLFDDGEKFGLWPGTHNWVYRRGWLKRFLSFLESGEVKVTTFSEHISSNPPTNRVYLPSVSYPEMGEWALPPETARRLDSLKKAVGKEDSEVFLRGGVWKNFLVRYPEANWLHKRVFWVSRQLRNIPASPEKRRAQRHLYRAQCNDAYWHGVFGGLYAPHLRRALWCQLLDAQRMIQARPKVLEVDLDCDGFGEVILQNQKVFAALKPSQGGCMVELSVLEWAENLTNVLTRRPEAYHWEMDPQGKEKAEGIPSIHQLESSPPRGVSYDGYQKGSFLDHLIVNPTRKAMEVEGLEEPLRLWELPYQSKAEEGEVILTVEGPAEEGTIKVEKSFRIGSSGITGEYHLEADSSLLGLNFGVELNLLLPSERFGEIKVLYAGGERYLPVLKGGVVRGCREVVLGDPLWKGVVRVGLSRPMDLFVVSNASVSRSERGFDRVYQGNTFLFAVPLKREREVFSVSLVFEEKGGNGV